MFEEYHVKTKFKFVSIISPLLSGSRPGIWYDLSIVCMMLDKNPRSLAGFGGFCMCVCGEAATMAV